MQRHKCGESAADQGTLPFLWRRKKIRQPFFGSAFLVHARRWKMVPQLIMALATVCRDLGSRAVVRGERCLRSRLSRKIHPHRRRLPARRRQRHHRAHGRGQDAGELEPAGGDRLQASSRIDFDTVASVFCAACHGQKNFGDASASARRSRPPALAHTRSRAVVRRPRHERDTAAAKVCRSSINQ